MAAYLKYYNILFVVLIICGSTNSFAVITLQNNTPYTTSLASYNMTNLAFNVPTGATKLTLSIAGESGDLGLYLKFGTGFVSGTIDEIRAQADVVSEELAANETIELTASSIPSIRPGTWYIGVLNRNTEDTIFTVNARTFDNNLKWTIPSAQIKKSYPSVENCQINADEISSLPICVGSVAGGGGNVSIALETEEFDGPVDVYFGIQNNFFSPEIFLLHPDNTLHPLSEAIAPWKAGIKKAISTKLFNDIQSSALPPGTYNLYLLISPQDNLDHFYLWATSFYIKPEIAHVAEGNIGYYEGALIVPNAEILSQGKIYEEMVYLPEDTLVGIYMDEKAYLYHTGMGNTVVSEETSRRAVGRFIYPDGFNLPTLSTRTYPPDELPVSGSITLGTGVHLKRPELLKVIAHNNQYRWAAISPKDGSGVIFLPPKSRIFDLNIINFIPTLVGRFTDVSLALDNYDVHIQPISLREPKQVLETFGAVSNYGVLSDGVVYPKHIIMKAAYGKLDSDYENNEWLGSLAKRYHKNPQLCEALDTIDLSYSTIEGLKALIGVLDPTEFGEPFANLFLNMADTAILYHKGAIDRAALAEAIANVIGDLATNLIFAGVNVLSATTTTPILTLLDIIYFMDYIVEGPIFQEYDTLTKLAYDDVFLPESKDVFSLFSAAEIFISPASYAKTEPDGHVNSSNDSYISLGSGFSSTDWISGYLSGDDASQFSGEFSKEIKDYDYKYSSQLQITFNNDYQEVDFILTEQVEEIGVKTTTEFNIIGLPLLEYHEAVEQMNYVPDKNVNICNYIKEAKKEIVYQDGTRIDNKYVGNCDDKTRLGLYISLEKEN